MFQKLHIKMTFFCTFVTGFILIAMTLAGLFLFETLLTQNDYAVFEKNKNSIIDYLENENLIDYSYLSKLTRSDMYTITLFENNRQLSLHGQKQTKLVEAARQKALADYHFDVQNPPRSRTKTKLLDFEMSQNAASHLVTVASLPNKYGSICAIILYSRTQLAQQKSSLRTAIFFIDTSALLLLFLFAWKFSFHILAPVEANRKKQIQFVAAASHELRSPLAVMLAGIEALKEAKEEERPEFHSSIESEGMRMKQLIDDMLALASADNQSWSMHFTDTAPDTMLLNIYEKYLPLFRNRGLKLTVHLPDEAVLDCFCDRQRLEQTIGILLDNALCYTPIGGRIILCLSMEKNTIKLGVADSGPGISDADKEHIFDRFFRVDSSRQDKQHFGLGLCIAKEIIELHHGRIWVEDNIPNGAIFYLSIPIRNRISE